MAKWRWHAGLEAIKPDAAFDTQTIFEQKCRQPGTRINWIMTMIERGLDDESVAARVKMRCGMDCSGADISVYRKALKGELCDMQTGRGPTSASVSLISQHFELVGTLYFNQLMSRTAVAEALSLERRTVDACIERYRTKYNASRRKEIAARKDAAAKKKRRRARGSDTEPVGKD